MTKEEFVTKRYEKDRIVKEEKVCAGCDKKISIKSCCQFDEKGKKYCKDCWFLRGSGSN